MQRTVAKVASGKRLVWGGLLAVAMLGGAAAGCRVGSSESSTDTKLNACGGNSQAVRTPGGFDKKALFLVSNVKDSTILCSLDTQSLALQEEYILPVDSNDVLLLSDGKTRDAFLVERWSSAGRASRVTRFSALTGAVTGELAGFPVNVYDLFRVKNESLLAVGWNKGEVSVSRADLSDKPTEMSLPPQTPAALAPGDKNADARLSLVLASTAGRIFTLATGIDFLQQYMGVQAKLHLLDASLAQVEQSFPIENPTDTTKICRNAFAAVMLSPSKAVVSCNPQWGGPKAGERVAVYLVDVSSGKPQFTPLLEADGAEVQSFTLSGANAAGTHVLVTELGHVPSSFTGETKSRFWLSIADGTRTASQLGGGMVYIPATETYVFSCIESEPEKSRACQSKTFAVVKSQSGALPTAAFAQKITVKHLNSFSQFSKTLHAVD